MTTVTHAVSYMEYDDDIGHTTQNTRYHGFAKLGQVSPLPVLI